MSADAAKPHPHLMSLSREVERNARRLSSLDDLVRGLAETLARVGERGDAQDTHAGPRSWLLSQDSEQAQRDLTDLGDWLERVYLRYPSVALPSCWAFHPTVVEELHMLRGAHTDAYTGRGASWARVADWHDRLRPGAVKRLSQAIGGCDLSLHTPNSRHGGPSPSTPMAKHLAHIADTYARTGAPPEPTSEQLTEFSFNADQTRTRA